MSRGSVDPSGLERKLNTSSTGGYSSDPDVNFIPDQYVTEIKGETFVRRRSQVYDDGIEVYQWDKKIQVTSVQ